MSALKNIHANNIIQAEPVIFREIYVYAYMSTRVHVIIDEKGRPLVCKRERRVT